MTQQVVTANRLGDGIVVYLTPGGDWSEWIAQSAIAAGEEEAAALLAQGQQAAEERIVVEPYLIAVAEIDGEVRPTRYRERIRATGPSVRPDLSKQRYTAAADAAKE